MGLVKVNPVVNYWSKNTLYNVKLPSTVMSRNRFEILLSNLHFTDNTSISPKDRQGKIINLMDKLQEKYQKVYTPGENIVIDETLIPWRGRLILRQYIPSKAHKYGIKMFKLCSSEGFTRASKIYSGKSSEGIRETGLAHNVCIKLAEKLFEKGRTLYVDNFYTSYELALTCLDRKTHLVGTLRHNKKSMPRDVLDCKLKKGEMIAKEDENGIVVLKWKDSRDVRMLSTKHAPYMVQTTKKCYSNQPATNLKPLAVVNYNKGKCGMDYSDQMVLCVTAMRKGVKWYRKLGIELLLGTFVVNALVVFKTATKRNIGIREFREMIASELLQLPSQKHNQIQSATRKSWFSHLLLRV